MLSFVPTPDKSPSICTVPCNGAGLQCPWGTAIPVLVLHMAPARFPWHPCGSYQEWDSPVTPVLPFHAALYHIFVQSITHLIFVCRFSFFQIEEFQPTKMPCIGKLFHIIGHFSKSSFTLFQSCFICCYEVKVMTASCMIQMEKLFLMHFLPNNS